MTTFLSVVLLLIFNYTFFSSPCQGTGFLYEAGWLMVHLLALSASLSLIYAAPLNPVTGLREKGF
jgi:hypothetical protein